jgi:hypothetical protein
MNERIKELAEQAVNAISDHVDFDIPDAFKEKFAELIVREVFVKIEDERFDIYEPVKKSVMVHFGVEE